MLGEYVFVRPFEYLPSSDDFDRKFWFLGKPSATNNTTEHIGSPNLYCGNIIDDA